LQQDEEIALKQLIHDKEKYRLVAVYSGQS